jgi:hypothetical protein
VKLGVVRAVSFPRVWLPVMCGLGAVAAVVVLGFLAFRPPNEALSLAAQQEIYARMDAVRAEIGALGPEHAWAGVYSSSEGRSSAKLAMAPRAGFASIDSVCNDYTTNCGSVTEHDGVVDVVPRFAGADVVNGTRSTRFVLVRWNARRYLVPFDRVDDFTSDVELGAFEDASARSEWLALYDTRDAPLSGRPVLPPQLARPFLAQPIDGTVLAARASESEPHMNARERVYELDLDRGADDGLRVGMRLALEGSLGLARPRVASLDAHSARATVQATGQHRVPLAGAAWSTRDRWR